jgi:fermentation-respiration switch protein FrsA (DUF1100 family)
MNDTLARGLIRRVLVFLFVTLAAIFVFAQYLRRTGMFFPDRFPTGRFDIKAWTVEPSEHYFTTSDGVKLHAWLFPAKEADAPVLIWCHGNAGNLTDRAEMAAELSRRGVSVFLFDWRGYGKSEGTPGEPGLKRDGLAAYDYVKASGATRIVLYGESVGGPFAAYVAKERKGGVRAVIIENSFPSLREMGNALYAPIPLGWAAPFALRTTAWLNEAGAPVLVMHGTRDQVIPYALGKKLYDGLTVEKELMTSHAGHSEIPLFEAERYYQTVTRFAKR